MSQCGSEHDVGCVGIVVGGVGTAVGGAVGCVVTAVWGCCEGVGTAVGGAVGVFAQLSGDAVRGVGTAVWWCCGVCWHSRLGDAGECGRSLTQHPGNALHLPCSLHTARTSCQYFPSCTVPSTRHPPPPQFPITFRLYFPSVLFPCIFLPLISPVLLCPAVGSCGCRN